MSRRIWAWLISKLPCDLPLVHQSLPPRTMAYQSCLTAVPILQALHESKSHEMFSLMFLTGLFLNHSLPYCLRWAFPPNLQLTTCAKDINLDTWLDNKEACFHFSNARIKHAYLFTSYCMGAMEWPQVLKNTTNSAIFFCVFSLNQGNK